MCGVLQCERKEEIYCDDDHHRSKYHLWHSWMTSILPLTITVLSSEFTPLRRIQHNIFYTYYVVGSRDMIYYAPAHWQSSNNVLGGETNSSLSTAMNRSKTIDMVINCKVAKPQTINNLKNKIKSDSIETKPIKKK